MIHQYKNNGYNIVLDVNSGSVHVVDDIVYDIIPVVEKMLAEGVTKREDMLSHIIRMRESGDIQVNQDVPESLLEEALEEILELKDAGMLLTEDL